MAVIRYMSDNNYEIYQRVDWHPNSHYFHFISSWKLLEYILLIFFPIISLSSILKLFRPYVCFCGKILASSVWQMIHTILLCMWVFLNCF